MPLHPPRKGDLPRAELEQRAQEVIEKYKGKAQVFFKFTCPHCGERCQFETPNALYENGICYKCGKEEPVHVGGFAVEFKY